MKVMGDLESGLILEAPRPSHLGGGRQSMILTPHEARELIAQLNALAPIRARFITVRSDESNDGR